MSYSVVIQICSSSIPVVVGNVSDDLQLACRTEHQREHLPATSR